MYRAAAPRYPSSSRGGGRGLYDATASFGRTSAEFGVWAGVVACLLLTALGAYVAFANKQLPSNKPTRPGAKPPSRKTRLIAGGVVSAVGLLVLCLAWGQRKMARSSKLFASVSGTSGLLSMF